MLSRHAERVFDVLSIESLTPAEVISDELSEYYDTDPDEMWEGLQELRNLGLARRVRNEDGTFYILTRSGQKLKRHRGGY